MDTWSWGGSVSHFGGSARRSVNTTAENRRNHTKVRSHKRTFHHHVKVVNDVSSRVLAFAHVLPSITVLHFRQDQKPTEVVKFCPRRQLLSHFHPLDFWSGTTTRNMVILYCQTNCTTVSGVKKPNLYIQSPRYTLELQKLSSQHHFLCLDTRGQQHAGHSHWGGFWRWEGNNHHIIWSSNVFKFSEYWWINVSLLYHQIQSQCSNCSQTLERMYIMWHVEKCCSIRPRSSWTKHLNVMRQASRYAAQSTWIHSKKWLKNNQAVLALI